MITSERMVYNYLLEKASEDQKADNKLSAFEKALEEFNELVEKGIIKERGYTLMTGSEMYNRDISFNMK